MRVVLADDSLLLREGVARLLEEAGLEVVAQAGDGEDLLRKVGAHKPDVAIVDVRMPPTHTDEGLRAAAEIRDKHPDTGVLVLSQYIEEAYAMELLSSNAEGVGYLLKDRVADLERFIDAVRRVGEGGSALDPEVVSRLLGRRRQEDPLAEISPRERQVLALMAEGRSNHAIATELVVTERAVEKHVTSIFTKLNLPPDGRRPPPRAGGADLPQGLVDPRGSLRAGGGWAPGSRRRHALFASHRRSRTAHRGKGRPALAAIRAVERPAARARGCAAPPASPISVGAEREALALLDLEAAGADGGLGVARRGSRR